MKWMDDKATLDWATWHDRYSRWDRLQLAVYRISHLLPYWSTDHEVQPVTPKQLFLDGRTTEVNE
jgi:hypothetical protein